MKVHNDKRKKGHQKNSPNKNTRHHNPTRSLNSKNITETVENWSTKSEMTETVQPNVRETNLQQAGMPLTDLEPNIEYGLCLTI